MSNHQDLDKLMDELVKANALLASQSATREQQLAAVGRVLDMAESMDLDETYAHKISVIRLMRNAMVLRSGIESNQ